MTGNTGLFNNIPECAWWSEESRAKYKPRKGVRHNSRHYWRVRSFLLRLGCDSTYRYKTSRRQAGLCLACITDRTACTHVCMNVWGDLYACRLQQDDDGWGRKMKERRSGRHVSEYPQTPCISWIWQRHRHHCLFQLGHQYILFPISLYFLFFLFYFFLAFPFLLFPLTFFHSFFLLLFLYLLFLPSSVSFFLSLFSVFTYSFHPSIVPVLFL
jgi:hypothetical protein